MVGTRKGREVAVDDVWGEEAAAADDAAGGEVGTRAAAGRCSR